MLPIRCVHASVDFQGACRIGVHHRRDRKTGPAFPIMVLQCYSHGHAFTLYPLGHFPYGRVAMAPVDLDGQVLWMPGDTQARTPAWSRTLFGAAVQLATSEPRPSAPARAARWWQTEQPDALAAPAALLGLDPELDQRAGQAVARQLELPRLMHIEAGHQYRAARGGTARARVLVGVIDQLLGPGRCLVDRLLGASAAAGLWGDIARWDPGTNGSCCRMFPGRGIPAG